MSHNPQTVQSAAELIQDTKYGKAGDWWTIVPMAVASPPTPAAPATFKALPPVPGIAPDGPATFEWEHDLAPIFRLLGQPEWRAYAPPVKAVKDGGVGWNEWGWGAGYRDANGGSYRFRILIARYDNGRFTVCAPAKLTLASTANAADVFAKLSILVGSTMIPKPVVNPTDHVKGRIEDGVAGRIPLERLVRRQVKQLDPFPAAALAGVKDNVAGQPWKLW